MLDELGLDRARTDRRRAHAARGLALPPLREPAVRRRARAPARASRRSSCRVPPSSAPSSWRPAGSWCPSSAIDAQSLIAYADLVISAGGTMNREAVALGTPVWTTFEGRLGAVDEPPDRRGPAAPARARGGRGAGQAGPAGRRCTDASAPRSADLLFSLTAAWPLRLAPRITLMRRRLGSAAFPVHRHSLPQVALDAGLVALAYFLAYRLRFDGRRRARSLPGPVRAHGRVRRGSAASRSSSLFGALPALVALLVPARLRAHRPGGASSPCSRLWATSRSSSRELLSRRRRAASSRSRPHRRARAASSC